MSFDPRYDRTVSLLGEPAFERIRNACVLVVGLGGVGGAVAEVLARCGVGRLTLVDGDCFEPTNLNRQILSTTDTIGKNKAVTAAERVKSIDPSIEVVAISDYFGEHNKSELLSFRYDHAADAIDDIKNKVTLITECERRGIPIISALGAGNRMDCGFCVTDIYKTKDDPFARKLRYELKRRGIVELKTVCATSPPAVRFGDPASVAAPPLVMGAMIANEIVRSIAKV